MFAPLAMATRVWGPTRSHARRATEVAVALIFSKLAIAVTLATGASLMQGAAATGGNVEMIQGSDILLLAAFMPFALLRVIPIMEGAVSAEGMARGVGTKAAVAGYGAAKVGSAISTSASSAGSSVRSRWENRKSASAAASTQRRRESCHRYGPLRTSPDNVKGVDTPTINLRQRPHSHLRK